jgi:hypothetical protein
MGAAHVNEDQTTDKDQALRAAAGL